MKRVVTLVAMFAALSGPAFAQAKKPAAQKPAAAKPVAKPPAKPVAPPTPLEQAILDARKVSGFAKDEFAAPVTTSLGQPFSVSFSPRSGKSTGQSSSAGYWMYEDGELRYTLMSRFSAERLVGEDDKVGTILFAGDLTAGKPYTAQNAYGASTTVSIDIWKLSALAVTSAPAFDYSYLDRKSNAKYADLGIKGMNSPPDDFPLFMTVAGEEARRLTQDIRVVVEGTIAPIKGSKATALCKAKMFEASISSPTEHRIETCYVGADITRVAYIDSASGKVLQEYTVAKAQ